MSKIIFEDHSTDNDAQKEITGNEFDEKVIEAFVTELIYCITQLTASFALSQKEVVFGTALLKDKIKKYSMEVSPIDQKELDVLDEWASERSEKWMERLRESGAIEKAQKAVETYKVVKKDINNGKD